MQKDRPVIFIHIPKAGGITLQQVIAQQFPMRAVKRTKLLEDGSLQGVTRESAANSIQFLWGHIPYGAHVYFSKPATYITMLCEPVSRVISFYYYAHQKRR